jgi:cytochrome c oxidase subunit I
MMPEIRHHHTAPLSSDPRGQSPADGDAAVEGVSVEAMAWLKVAIGSLIVAGLLSLAVVMGRMPFFGSWVPDPHFFKRCLVVHVDLALIVWFYACLSALESLRRGSRWERGRSHRLQSGLWPVWGAVAGVAMMMAGAWIPDATPILANYIPVLDHPVFLAGLALVFLSFAGHLIPGLLRTSAGNLPADTALGLRAAGVGFAIALSTWVASMSGLPSLPDAYIRYESMMWGVGHVLQCVNVAAMLAVWCWLAKVATGRQAIPTRVAAWGFAFLVLPWAVAPLLTLQGTLNNHYFHGFTQLMRWALFPVVLVLGGGIAAHLIRNREQVREERARMARAGLVASMALTVMGFIIGAMIRSSTTLIPAHYHASLGAVTAAFMTAAYLLASCREPGISHSLWFRCRVQLILFGAGQSVFALGFAIGGLYGLGRKTYGADQHVRSTGPLRAGLPRRSGSASRWSGASS